MTIAFAPSKISQTIAVEGGYADDESPIVQTFTVRYTRREKRITATSFHGGAGERLPNGNVMFFDHDLMRYREANVKTGTVVRDLGHSLKEAREAVYPVTPRKARQEGADATPTILGTPIPAPTPASV